MKKLCRPYSPDAMGRKRNNGLSEEKRNIIGQLIEMYDIKTAADIQEALKDLLGGTIQSMLEAELDEQVEEREEADPEYHDSRKGYKPKTLRSSMGEIPIQVPQDRNSDFEPQVVPKYKKNISEIGKDHCDVCPRDERGAGLGADQGHLGLRGQ